MCIRDSEGAVASRVCGLEELVRHPQVLAVGEAGLDKLADEMCIRDSYWYSMHELSRMDDETGDPLPGDRRLAPIPVGFTVRSLSLIHIYDSSRYWF